jgi:KipI family sensor histidine kinase inhibitor
MARVVPFGEAALLVEWAEHPDLRVNARVHALAAALRADPPPGLRGVTPAYVSLLVEFDPLATDVRALHERLLQSLDAPPPELPSAAHRVREIPTVYGGEFGPDLREVARRTGLSEQEVVRSHVATTMTVYMIGFSPGYPYMGDLPSELRLPRRATPREQVPPGSVAIADRQSSIYTRATPGGWHLIGRTPLVLFDERRDPPAYFAPGDRVRHVPIAASAWDAFAGPAADW